MTAGQNPQQAQTASRARGDIEGLRALSVVLVILSHLLGAPAGGFIGVDIFFVISGFLITGLLVKEHQGSGSISFRDFYARRIRRIAPAAAVTLLVTCVASQLIFIGTRAHQTLVDAVWATLSLGNWHMANIGTDYFQSGRPASAVQHYWSLSVEEQFYLVWPVIIAATAGAVNRRWGLRDLRGPLSVVLGALVITSFGWSMYESITEPTNSYFSTASRAWELGAGALLALVVHRLPRLPNRINSLLSGLGLLTIIGSCFVIAPQSTFPAPWAALPVLGAVLLIATGSAGNPASHLILLTNPLSRYIGRISYSLYLWHWPVLIILPSVLPKSAPTYTVVAVITFSALAAASYHWVETPFRRSHWLSSGGAPGHRRRFTLEQSAVAVLLAISVVTSGAAATIHLSRSHGAGAPIAAGNSGIQAAQSTPQTSRTDGSTSPLASLISTSLAADEWPELTPAPDQLDGAKAVEWAQCGNVSAATELGCRFGAANAPAKNRAILIGDSIAISWLPGVRKALEPKGWQVLGLTWGQCPAPRIDTSALDSEAQFTTVCGQHQQWALDEVMRQKPALVIMASAENTLRRLPCCPDLTRASSAWHDAQLAAAKRLSSAGGRVVILAPPPEGKSLAECATRLNRPEACVTRVSEQWQAMSLADIGAAKDGGATYVDTSAWFCDAAKVCPSFVGTTTVFADGTHLTSTYSAQLAPQLATALLPTAEN